jgi:hypothetical protein
VLVQEEQRIGDLREKVSSSPAVGFAHYDMAKDSQADPSASFFITSA